MLAWLFTSPDSPRSKRLRRWILGALRLALVPVDGDTGRVPRAVRAGTGPDAPSREAAPGKPPKSRPAAPAPHPPLPTHGRNAVEEWIPPALLYGPPR